jgi:uracil phosphoribosyltransferase/adenylate kinase/phosphoserine phosphatase
MSASENSPSYLPGAILDTLPSQSIAPESRSASEDRAIVVGLYGVPGSGKTFLLNLLKQELGEDHFEFYDGSKMIATVVPGGLDAFQNLEEREKLHWRQIAIDKIGKECAERGRVGVVAGHFIFWPEEDETWQPVYTPNDLNTFTHILYLDIPAEVVAQRRKDDSQRSRPSVSVNHLRNWQQAEKNELRRLCRHNGILFAPVSSPHPTLVEEISTLLLDFRHHTEGYNLYRAESILDEAVFASGGHSKLETVLVLDADKTLTAEDTGALFWKMATKSRHMQPREDECPLKALFSSALGYTYTAFRQAALLYGEIATDQEFEAICEDVASVVSLYPEFVSLLQLVAEQEHVAAVVMTCGLRCVWDKVLRRKGLSQKVKVIGGGRIADRVVVTAEVKGALVARLRNTHQMYVWAFGDSVLDLAMLGEAHQAIVVVGEEHTRSKTMDAALLNAINKRNLRARQVLLPDDATPRLDTSKLPLVQLADPEFINSVLRSHNKHPRILHATERNAAKLLMTPARDASVSGPTLRQAHGLIGRYLATEFLADVIGIEEYPIPHVQGHTTSGHRLCNEKQTSIVALMRGGEPMAFGVSDVFPMAMFVHASQPDEIKLHQLQNQRTVFLVDSVIDSGKTAVQFVQHIRGLHATIRIVIVAGVVHAQSVHGGSLGQALARDTNLSLAALRLSDNTFTGRGITDTGNRLFNTTHLP